MKRAPLVIGGTVAGLVGVLSFHTKPSPSDCPRSAARATATRAAPVPAPAPAQGQPRRSPQARSSAGGRRVDHPGSGGQQAGAARRSAGPAVNYNYGILSVRVTVSGSKILKVGDRLDR